MRLLGEMIVLGWGNNGSRITRITSTHPVGTSGEAWCTLGGLARFLIWEGKGEFLPRTSADWCGQGVWVPVVCFDFI